MKKIFLSLIMCFAITALIAQEVPRTMVAMEISTNIFCTYCPGAAMGADDLLAHGCQVAVMEDHNNGQGADPYANSYSIARTQFYGMSGNPTAAFDGILKVVGGSHTQSMYNTYLPKYNQRINTPAHISMSMQASNSGLDYTVIITSTKVGALPNNAMHLLFAVTQSHIAQNWEGQTHLEYVNRLMVPGSNGKVIDFASGDTRTDTLTFSMDAAWPVEDCEFIAFVQDYVTKEIQQTIKRGVIDLTSDFTANNTIVAKDAVVTFTSDVSGGYMNVPQTYEWHFPGATPDTSTMANATVTYTECGIHDVLLIVNRGGQIDSVNKIGYMQVGTIATLNATPNDSMPQDQSIVLDATTPNATYLWLLGGQTTPTITVDGNTAGLGAHTYYVTVSTPDGCVQTLSKTIWFFLPTGIAENTNDLSARIYPNPNNGTFTLDLNTARNESVNVKIINALNTTIYEENGIQVNKSLQRNFTLNSLSNGMYFLIIQNSDTRVIQKFFVK
jgi:PKD repeat protein